MIIAARQQTAERPRDGPPPGTVSLQSGCTPASHQPASEASEAAAPSLQELVEYQRGFHERTIPLWQVMLKRMGMQVPGSQHHEDANGTP